MESRRRSRAPRRRPRNAAERSFERVALVLQGGGALGSYQAGVYQALLEAGVAPDWIAGISIGAINSAIIVGNPPERRIERLRSFWEQITTDLPGSHFELPAGTLFDGDLARGVFTQLSSWATLVYGMPGFFRPRLPPPWALQAGTPGATSFYDTGELRRTLQAFVDFDRINAGPTRLSLGAVNVRTGNFAYFDTTTHTIGPEHVMASGALPPGFPPVEVDGEFYWDGGLVSNTPLAWVLGSLPAVDTLVFQVDLWSARGHLPRDLGEANAREKDIRYSSRTRLVTDVLKRRADIHRKVKLLLEKLPAEYRDLPELKELDDFVGSHVFNVVHLIYRAKNYENYAKDYEFSRMTMRDHWRAGLLDAQRTLGHPEIFSHPDGDESVQTFDFEDDA